MFEKKKSAFQIPSKLYVSILFITLKKIIGTHPPILPKYVHWSGGALVCNHMDIPESSHCNKVMKED